MRWLRRICNRVKPAPRPVEIDLHFKPEWGHIVAHNSKKQGANSFDRSYSEYTYGNILSHSLSMPSETRDAGGVSLAAKRLVKKGCTASIECHYNAFNGKASGLEILVLKGDDFSAKYAKMIISEAMSTPTRTTKLRADGGIKWISKGDRGYYNLVNAKSAGMKVAILTELFFGDNQFDFIGPSKQAKIINGALSEHV